MLKTKNGRQLRFLLYLCLRILHTYIAVCSYFIHVVHGKVYRHRSEWLRQQVSFAALHIGFLQLSGQVSMVNKVYSCWCAGWEAGEHQGSQGATVSNFRSLAKVKMTDGRECCLPESGPVFCPLGKLCPVNSYCGRDCVQKLFLEANLDIFPAPEMRDNSWA